MIKSFFLGALLLSGCTSVQFAPATPSRTFSVRTSPEKVALYRAQRPTEKFTEIGSVIACCGNDATRLFQLLQKRASEVGGDALLDLDFTAEGQATASVVRFDRR